ncbi:MAG: NUDIX hydrolase [Pseudomonadota bacterium]
MTDVPVRPAATVILVRNAETRPAVLMGQRGAGAAFMASKTVFPGGAVDPGDRHVTLARPLAGATAEALSAESDVPATALATAAIRELWEETGQVLGRPGTWADAPSDWDGFAATGHQPDASALAFVFRAITPPGRPRRFDARFFIASAEALGGDPDDFSAASDELSHLRWITLTDTRQADLPFITTVVLAEIAARLPLLGQPDTVPFFQTTEEAALFRRLGASTPDHHT